MTGHADLQASNLGAIGRPLYLDECAGDTRPPDGPRPGIPAMVATLMNEGTCCTAINFGPEAIAHAAPVSTCMRERLRRGDRSCLRPLT